MKLSQIAPKYRRSGMFSKWLPSAVWGAPRPGRDCSRVRPSTAVSQPPPVADRLRGPLLPPVSRCRAVTRPVEAVVPSGASALFSSAARARGCVSAGAAGSACMSVCLRVCSCPVVRFSWAPVGRPPRPRLRRLLCTARRHRSQKLILACTSSYKLTSHFLIAALATADLFIVIAPLGRRAIGRPPVTSRGQRR